MPLLSFWLLYYSLLFFPLLSLLFSVFYFYRYFSLPLTLRLSLDDNLLLLALNSISLINCISLISYPGRWYFTVYILVAAFYFIFTCSYPHFFTDTDYYFRFFFYNLSNHTIRFYFFCLTGCYYTNELCYGLSYFPYKEFKNVFEIIYYYWLIYGGVHTLLRTLFFDNISYRIYSWEI